MPPLLKSRDRQMQHFGLDGVTCKKGEVLVLFLILMIHEQTCFTIWWLTKNFKFSGTH